MPLRRYSVIKIRSQQQVGNTEVHSQAAQFSRDLTAVVSLMIEYMLQHQIQWFGHLFAAAVGVLQYIAGVIGTQQIAPASPTPGDARPSPA